MKRLIFFCALMGIFLTVNAGPRIDVDIGDQVLTETVYILESPEINNTPVAIIGPAMNVVESLVVATPGELSVLSANVDQEGSKLYTRIPVGPGADMQGMMNYEMDELISKIDLDLRKMAKIYNLVYEPLTRDRNDLKKSGAED